jgi:hypothetical protein
MTDVGGITFGSSNSIVGSETANSLTLGALQGGTVVPYLNTDEGILPYDIDSVGTEFQYDFDDGSGITQSVLDSGGFTDASNDLYAYFQYDGGLGGVWDNGVGDKEWLSEVDLSSFVSGQPVYDLEVVLDTPNVYGYFATKLGAFRLADSILRNSDVDTAQEVFDHESTRFFGAKIDGVYVPVTEIAVIGGTDVYLGTARGVVKTAVTDIAPVIVPPDTKTTVMIEGDSLNSDSMVIESLGRYVEDIVAGGRYVAILTRQFVLVSNDNGENFTAVPLVASSAGEATAIFLDSIEGALLVSGSTGLAGLYIDDTVTP